MLQVLQDVVNNPDLAEMFLIVRQPGAQGPGGWQASEPQNIPTYGTVSVARQRELEMVAEADRVHEVRVFHTTTPMYTTSADLSITSDILVWQGIQYRILSVMIYPQRGYYGALAVRMAGQ